MRQFKLGRHPIPVRLKFAKGELFWTAIEFPGGCAPPIRAPLIRNMVKSIGFARPSSGM
ncbi:MAG: hypothetical protein AAFY25_11015 [Pseudomonadota bacterium]